MREEISAGIVSRATRLQRSPMLVCITSETNRSIWVLTMCIAIQGKDCLVQKFRNSSVMLELEHYRPKASIVLLKRFCVDADLSSSSSLSMGHILNRLARKNLSLDRITNPRWSAAVKMQSMLVSTQIVYWLGWWMTADDDRIGLFTPNAGQHFRDEQRRRRSQFDRGTRLAALEEFDRDLNYQHNFYSSQ